MMQSVRRRRMGRTGATPTAPTSGRMGSVTRATRAMPGATAPKPATVSGREAELHPISGFMSLLALSSLSLSYFVFVTFVTVILVHLICSPVVPWCHGGVLAAHKFSTGSTPQS